MISPSWKLIGLIGLALVSVGLAPAADPTFDKQGVAFLKSYCLNCHSGDRPKAELSLSKYNDAKSLVRDRKTWQRVVEVVQTGEMPPANKPRPELAESEQFLKLVKSIFDEADKTAKPDPGRVTMRRLNRTEYNNTIRDLVGVDFAPAADFPSDDVGHGFDNIGDVLTLPPVLLERYLAAAEAVMNRAITPRPAKSPERWIGGQYLEPASAKVPLKNNWRMVSGKPSDDAVETGPIHTAYQVPPDGEYIFQARVRAETEGQEPVRVAILAVCDKSAPGVATEAEKGQLHGAAVNGLWPFIIVKTVEVKGTEQKPQIIEAQVPAGIGLKRMAVALIKPKQGEPAPTLYIQNLFLRGPLDTRPATQKKLLACDTTKPQAEQTREVLNRFVSRAYRRPATKEEVDRLAKFVDATVARGEPWEAGIQLAMQAVLVSPKFLFRIELDHRPAGPESRPISEFQLASRLSYFLWSSMPDEELFELARKNQLTANLDAQVRRMLQDPKANSLVDSFAMQWLQLQNLRNFQPDPKLFPQFNERLRASMIEETRLFIQAIIREDRKVSEILDADFTYLNNTLAAHYGIRDTAGNPTGGKGKRGGGRPFNREEFVRVDLSGTDRGGILTQASVLTVTSNPTRTSPVKRGRWVLEQLLGTPPPPPPPDVPELEADGKPLNAGSLRQQMEAHRKNPACANCHAKMDPLGFGLENYNAIGAFRRQDGLYDIDPSGVLPDGSTFNGPAELKNILLAKKELFARCLAEKMLTFAIGRGLEYYDKRAVDSILAHLKKHDERFSALVVGIVTSDPFRLRRGTDQP